ncbi:hypothetical protein PanWU01x14_308160 [Parasponia andersonii]|uniref:Transmembrane protein n=1 Tax=Parasponia andersonii TaxID=3476 RepID=A0A2P5AR28_PARAD|nr:hypothetical protein PanWU01x14_308160 [Parasponia andersonii]
MISISIIRTNKLFTHFIAIDNELRVHYLNFYFPFLFRFLFFLLSFFFFYNFFVPTFLVLRSRRLQKPVSQSRHFHRIRPAPHKQQSILRRNASTNPTLLFVFFFLFFLLFRLVLKLNPLKNLSPLATTPLLYHSLFFISHHQLDLSPLSMVTVLYRHQPPSKCRPTRRAPIDILRSSSSLLYFITITTLSVIIMTSTTTHTRRSARQEAVELGPKSSQSFTNRQWKMNPLLIPMRQCLISTLLLLL